MNGCVLNYCRSDRWPFRNAPFILCIAPFGSVACRSAKPDSTSPWTGPYTWRCISARNCPAPGQAFRRTSWSTFPSFSVKDRIQKNYFCQSVSSIDHGSPTVSSSCAFARAICCLTEVISSSFWADDRLSSDISILYLWGTRKYRYPEVISEEKLLYVKRRPTHSKSHVNAPGGLCNHKHSGIRTTRRINQTTRRTEQNKTPARTRAPVADWNWTVKIRCTEKHREGIFTKYDHTGWRRTTTSRDCVQNCSSR